MTTRLQHRLRHLRQLFYVLATTSILAWATLYMCMVGRVTVSGLGRYLLAYGSFLVGIITVACFLMYRDVRRRCLRGEHHHSTHCRACGYNLTGLPEPRCPECGTEFDPATAPRAVGTDTEET